MTYSAHCSPIRLFLRSAQCHRPISTRPYIPILALPRHNSTSKSHARTPTGLSRPLQRPPTFLVHLRSLSTPSPSTTTLVDSERPSLFYHLLPSPNPFSTDIPAYAVSLLDQPPKDVQSPAVLGWLPAALPGNGGGGEEEAGLGDFKENQKFLDVLHKVIQNALSEGNDERLKSEAIQLGEGWMHINDDRNLPEMGRICSPDDIIGTVRVEGGKILPETYNPMPTYRICTPDGLTTLSEGLQERLLEELRKIDG